MAMENPDVIILGAGAAGLMCAISAGRRGKRVLLLDHMAQPGGKILISGGGRCNFTNVECRADRFLSGNPHFAKSALAAYRPADFVGLVEQHGIAFHEKTLGQLFCDGSARQILAMLLAECEAVGVELRLGCQVAEVSRDTAFRVDTSQGGFSAPALVLATGGLSIPKLGATGMSYDIARHFGLAVVAPRPGLVPLTFGGDDLALMQPLAGVALEVQAQAGKRGFREGMLFTHRGLSGPAVLQASSYWQPGEALVVNLLPGQDARAALLERKRARPKAEGKTVLAELLPNRLAAALAERHLPPRIMAEVPDKALNMLGALLNHWHLTPDGTEGFYKAEVTLGGVDTEALQQKDMQAKAVPGLFVIGEAVDVTGWLGGYNFQWAWSSGWVAGQAV
jgi:predicted Rossmann fold flavoprotein